MEAQDKQVVVPRPMGIDFTDIISRIIKYLVEGGAVAVAAYLIPQKKLRVQEVIMVALTAAAVFAILDMYAPAVSMGARQGTGFAIGASTVGFGGVPLQSGSTVVPGIPPPM
ncbi:MAG: hypothetical protein ABIN35_00610 [candidate division WOR-3 bacterium]